MNGSLFLRLFTPLSLLLIVFAGFYGNQAIKHELAQIRNQETASVMLGAGALSSKMESVGHNLKFLSSYSALQDAVEQASSKNIAHLAEDFSVFSGSSEHYDQIRWIDEHGMERVRVDYVQGKPRIISADKLQNKAERYYFTDTIKLGAGEVFVSPLDLNIEHNEIEVPYKPMIRVATPVHDQQGHSRGIVILNYYGNELLEAFSRSVANIADHTMVINRDGYWLKSSNQADEWGFMFNRPELGLATRFPGAWERIRSADKGQLELADGLWTWEKVYPLHANQKTSLGLADAFSQSRASLDAGQYYWVSVAHISKNSLNAIRYNIGLKTLAIASIFLILIGLFSWLLMRSWDALASEKLKFNTIADFAYDWETWLDPNGHYLYCSPSCLRITGHSASEFMTNLNLLPDIAHPDDRLRLEMHLRQHTASDPPCEFDFRIVRPDGQVCHLEHACQSVFSDKGEFLGRRASNRNITERKQAESALRNNEERLKEAQSVAQIGNWDLDLVTGQLIWSDEIFRLFEINPGKFKPSYESFLNAVHVADRDAVNTAYRRSLEKQEPYEITHRLQMSDGRIKWVVERCNSFFDVDGKAIRSIGTVQDITAAKHVEDALQESNERLHSLLDSMAEGAYGVDINGNCTFVNKSFLQILGYEDADEIIGKHIHELIHHSHPDGSSYLATECRMYNAYRHNQAIHVADEVFWKKDGVSIPVEYWSQPLLMDGVMSGAIATFVDISERKSAEAKIHSLAFYDPLTHLPNRRLLNDRLDQTIAASKRNNHCGAVMFLDLDNFKALNDTCGHDAGDLLLIEAARRINSCVREIDTVARLGGDEFVVILGDLGVDTTASAGEAAAIAEKIRIALSTPYSLLVRLENKQETAIVHRCTSSIGVVIFNYPANRDDLLKWADTAMYTAKNAGRNRVVTSQHTS